MVGVLFIFHFIVYLFQKNKMIGIPMNTTSIKSNLPRLKTYILKSYYFNRYTKCKN